MLQEKDQKLVSNADDEFNPGFRQKETIEEEAKKEKIKKTLENTIITMDECSENIEELPGTV